MARSQNGYPANDVTLTDVYTVPGTKVRMRLRKGPCAEALLIFLARFDDEVEDIDTVNSYAEDPVPAIAGGLGSRLFDDWSYAERTVRGSDDLSNHASGTAADFNATQHPLGVRGTFTAEQRRRMKAISDDLVDPRTRRPVLRLGEFYSGRVDGMHVEIDDDEAAVERAVEDYKRRHAPAPPKADEQEDDDMFIAHTADPKDTAIYLVAGDTKRRLPNTAVADELIKRCGVREVKGVSTAVLDQFATR